MRINEVNWKPYRREVLGIPTLFLLVACFSGAFAQSDEQKFEVGGQLSSTGVSARTVTVGTSGLNIVNDQEMISGLGGRVGYNFSKFLALEGEVNLFPGDSETEGGRKVQLVAGLKVGKRFNGVGFFAKARPGFVRYSKGNYTPILGGSLCNAISPTPISCFTSRASTNLALDVGGVVELYPSKRTILRFDAGDSIVWRGSRIAAALQPRPPGTFGPTIVVGVPVSAETTHNFQLSLGFGIRF